ncbi:vWA domain-containing protein [Cupriavidus basilensis]|uniref:vWA domain-containing protein n=1 Tax=Cupriavidus basilensis TaxID=68895 RepID=UPI0023E7AD13|nr:VWA-like domain-containing protein [Cupriavidus basilensis]MDF3881494.1 VWA-like domain-containing protein [Cupriavidus basilensis]
MRDRISKQRSQLILSQPFFGALLMRLRVVEDPSCKTFWVDGVSLGYNPAFVATLSDLELRGCLAHEVLHPANGHCWRRGVRDPDRWNQACDYAINPLVLNAGLQLPAGALIDGRFLGKSAEEIYAMLRQEVSEQPQPEPQPQPRQDGCGKGDGNDPAQPNGQDGKGNGTAGDDPSQASPEFSPGEVRQQPQAQQQTLANEWKVATMQATKAAQMRGKLPGELSAMVESATRASVDWRSVLHRFAFEQTRSDYSWALPNRRYTHMGLYLPALHDQSVGDAVFVRDTSGSVFDETQQQFGAEVETVFAQLQPRRLFVLDCDTRVTQVQCFERGEAIELGPIRGGGGTSFRAPFAWLDEQGIAPAFLVYLTDMHGKFPAAPPAYPTLWASTTPLHTIAPPPFGEAVEVII